MPPRHLRRQKQRIFVGCEGRSEYNYGAFLQRIVIDSQRQDRHLVRHDLGGGDPLSQIERAKMILEREHHSSGRFLYRVLFVDADVRGRNAERDSRFDALADKFEICIIWQRPCFEGFLLRHFPGCAGLQPPTPKLSMTSLQQQWPGYQKSASANEIGSRITLADVRSARNVEIELDTFLNAIGVD